MNSCDDIMKRLEALEKMLKQELTKVNQSLTKICKAVKIDDSHPYVTVDRNKIENKYKNQVSTN